MSELINNKEHRQQKLKELIMKLHDGATVEQVKEEFAKLTEGVTVTEITQMEQALVDEGMPVSEIQRMCDVHAAVFRGSIEDIHNDEAYLPLDFEEGHPMHTFKRENHALQKLIEGQIEPLTAQSDQSSLKKNRDILLAFMIKLYTIDKHYKRKENLIFPFMEKYEITAPPKVMWGIDDEIRGLFKSIISNLRSVNEDVNIDNIKHMVDQIKEMIFKEEEIMIPMVMEKFTQAEWAEIERESEEFGYALIDNVKRWAHAAAVENETAKKPAEAGGDISGGVVQADSSARVLFDAGSLTAEEINAILNTIPVDMTFVGADDKVKYITQGKSRIFERPKTIVGREVKNCHPPKSVHIVEKIVEDLSSGAKDNEDFWIRMGDRFVYIRYFAVRNKQGEFLGTLEVSQDIKPITELEGEKRLMS